MSHELHRDDEDARRCLVFALGGDLYGAPLTTVREVLRIGSVNAVPYMLPHFKGVMNLRGSIVSVIDLRVKFGLSCQGDGLIITVEGASDVIGAVVDDVVAVLSLAPGELSRDLALQTRVPAEFFLGVAKLGERLVNVIDIAKALDADDYAAIRRMA